MIIVGAGSAGLLAAAMLREQVNAVIEAQPGLPENHSALLRFRTIAVSEALNIPFKRVQVLKASQAWKNPVADAIAYSQKTNGKGMLRSIVSARGEIADRFIAPIDLVHRMSKKIMAPIRYGETADFKQIAREGLPAISTVPMPILMDALGWPNPPRFEYSWLTVVRCDLGPDIDFYCSLYVPDPGYPMSRISITGSEILIESGWDKAPEMQADTMLRIALRLVGLEWREGLKPVSSIQRYGKILPIDEDVRRKFVMWASQKFGIYSLGRFATWRPGLLMDDLVNDVRVISRLIGDSSEAYSQAKRG
jgi:hypothetical protein